MKKRFWTLLMVFTLSFSMVGCGSQKCDECGDVITGKSYKVDGDILCKSCAKFTCSLCGEKKYGERHTYKVLGEKGIVCDDCYDAIKALEDLFQ